MIVETISTDDWQNHETLQLLNKYLSSKEKASPVASINSSLPCFEEKYISSIGHEANHLILSIKKGSFPI